MDKSIKFIHKNGRIIPIRVPGSIGKIAKVGRAAAGAVGVGIAAHEVKPKKKTALQKLGAAVTRKQPAIKTNRLMQLSSVGLSVAEGALTGLTLGHGVKANVASHAAGLVLEGATVGLAAGAYVGKGQGRARAKKIAKQEAFNQVAGWGTYAATILARPTGRKAAAEIASKGVGYAAKILKLGRAALKVV